MKILLPIGLLVLMACAKPVPQVLPIAPEIQASAQIVVTVSVGQSVNWKLMAKVAPHFVVSGTVPPGLTISRVNGALSLKGIAKQAGNFAFTVQ